MATTHHGQAPRPEHSSLQITRHGIGTLAVTAALGLGMLANTFLSGSSQSTERAQPDTSPAVKYLEGLPTMPVRIPTGLGAEYAARQADPVAFTASHTVHDALLQEIDTQSVGGPREALQAGQSVDAPVVPLPLPEILRDK